MYAWTQHTHVFSLSLSCKKNGLAEWPSQLHAHLCSIAYISILACVVHLTVLLQRTQMMRRLMMSVPRMVHVWLEEEEVGGAQPPVVSQLSWPSHLPLKEERSQC